MLVISIWAVPAALPTLSFTSQQPKQEKFGGSLKRLKWDAKKHEAVEKTIHETKATKKESAVDNADSGDTAVKLSTLLVVFDVLVTDKSGKEIKGLTRDDFLVLDQGQPQQIESFSIGADPAVARRIILLMDRSGSERAYIAESIAAAENLVDLLSPRDEVAVVDDDVDLVTGYTADRAKVKRALGRIRSFVDASIRFATAKQPRKSSGLDEPRRNPYEGRSLQFTALFAALRELMPNDGTLPIIIFQTDGDEAPTFRDQPEADEFVWNMPSRSYGLSDIFRAAERSRATVYSVIPSEPLLGIPPAEVFSRGRNMLEQMERARFDSEEAYAEYARTHPLSDAKVKLFTQRFVEGQQAAVRVAELTGGWSAYLETPDQADTVYSKILSDIRNRYVIGYYPTAAGSDGRLHKVRIEVKNHPEYLIHGRDSYFEPEKQ